VAGAEDTESSAPESSIGGENGRVEIEGPKLTLVKTERLGENGSVR
jgi:hypothetical protein